jgi:hypothetical protein
VGVRFVEVTCRTLVVDQTEVRVDDGDCFAVRLAECERVGEPESGAVGVAAEDPNLHYR